jgi:DNA-binding IclR family transcriptional regulator
MSQNTENTITDNEALFDELAEIRERGYSFANEEQMEAIRAVGAPIFGPRENIVGAIAVSGPASGFQGTRFREELPDKVTQAANTCEVNLRASNVG